jgi:hypothetical protein
VGGLIPLAPVRHSSLSPSSRPKFLSAPPTLIQKYPELRRFADSPEDSGDLPGPQLLAMSVAAMFHQVDQPLKTPRCVLRVVERQYGVANFLSSHLVQFSSPVLRRFGKILRT